MDLSGWNFQADGVVKLDGEWEFYWRKLYSPEDFKSRNPAEEPRYFAIPNLWNDYEIEGKPLPGEGYATYRLKVRKPPSTSLLGMKILDMGTSYRIWINGKPLMGNGIVGDARSNSKPEYLPQSHALACIDDTIEIVLQVSNFYHRKGGVWKPIELGLSEQVKNERFRSLAFELFLCGSLLIMGLYHLVFFIARKKETAFLYFSVACLLTALRALLTGERYLMTLLPQINWELLEKLEYLTFYLGVPIFILFLEALVPEFNRKLIKLLLYITAVTSVVTIVTPLRIYSHTMLYFQLVAGFYCLYIVFGLIIAVLKKRQNAAWILVGVAVLVITVFHDLLVVNEILFTLPVAPFGLFFFILAQSMLLSRRLSNSFTSMEIMSDELSAYANQMEELVERRTTKLNESNLQLRRINEKISSSISYASIIQHSLLPSIKVCRRHIPDSFYIWQPRDVVGGDYFFFEPIEDGYLLAVIDCTGHGIPGAFMTMLASSSLRRVIVEENCKDPAEILNRLNYIVKTTLRQDKRTTPSDNGFDGSICYVNPSARTLIFAGARLPLCAVHNSMLDIYQGDRQSVGYKNSDFDYQYQNHIINYESGTTFYMFTDGIIDQPIAPKRFPIGQRQFKKLLLDHYQEPFDIQEETIMADFTRMLGNNEICDDITLIGFKP